MPQDKVICSTEMRIFIKIMLRAFKGIVSGLEKMLKGEDPLG